MSAGYSLFGSFGCILLLAPGKGSFCSLLHEIDQDFRTNPGVGLPQELQDGGVEPEVHLEE